MRVYDYSHKTAIPGAHNDKYLHVVIILLCYFVCDWLGMRIFSNLMETLLILAIYFLKHSTCVAIDAGLHGME